MKHLIDPLKRLGLSEKEAQIYLTLLQLGPSTPYQIAKKAELKRPTAYVIAEELVKKGLIVHLPGEAKKRYIAKTPDNFIEDQEERLSEAKKILPELRSFQKGISEKPSIMYFEGLTGLSQAYQYKHKEMIGKEIVGFFASNENASPALNKFFEHWHAYRQKHHIALQGITVDSPDLKVFSKFLNDKADNLDLKFLPAKLYNSQVSIESCDNQFVRIFLFESVETLIIESPKFAAAIKDIFEIVWNSFENKYNKPNSWKNVTK